MLSHLFPHSCHMKHIYIMHVSLYDRYHAVHRLRDSRQLIFTLLPTRWKAFCNQLVYPLAADKLGLQTLPPCLRNHYVTLRTQQRQITDVLRAKKYLPWRLSTPFHMQGAILALLPISPISTSQPQSPSAPTSDGPK